MSRVGLARPAARVRADLTGAVCRAFEPAHVSVWVAAGGRRDVPGCGG